MKKKTEDIVLDAFGAIEKLNPTPKEIAAYAKWAEEEHYGVVTGDEYKYGEPHFLRFHNTYRIKWGGRCHIDLGCADPDVPEWIIHLMLDKWAAPEFVTFVRERREIILHHSTKT